MEEEEEFEILESKMNHNFSLEEEREIQLNNQLSGPYSLQIKAIIEKLRLIDEESDKQKNSVLFHKLSKLFDLPVESDTLPKNCRKRGLLYTFTRRIKGKKTTIISSHNLEEAIEKYHEFCKENNLKYE